MFLSIQPNRQLQIKSINAWTKLIKMSRNLFVALAWIATTFEQRLAKPAAALLLRLALSSTGDKNISCFLQEKAYRGTRIILVGGQNEVRRKRHMS